MNGRLGWIALAVSGLAHVALLAWNPEFASRESAPSLVRPAPPVVVKAASPRNLEPQPAAPSEGRPMASEPVVPALSPTPSLARAPARVTSTDVLDEIALREIDLPRVAPEGRTTLPVLIHGPDPPYPLEARRKRIEGTVLIAVLVDERGDVADCRIALSSGYGPFDAAAMETARARWRFRPATQGREDVPRWVRIPVRFHLRAPTR